ncbi:hypothetical protein H8356DRAFT_1279572 [Neocallimastix lanati (nom. inval.)]|uniref:Uncharacterized protein n=1 Tax=Neocallimastix californiae TaxID=1754190 RepID=A0A1Y1ZQF6_9FUNG|nr:hypothetical protein H8356DRAFT_1279572 [Neocallimastix sp. JGI-2020a]ORY12482.1 hypothetical protein LY90DRAFT_518350 [Neocallimastix californiae]|eukprot:ORY12482.1 hypothetical protein LY90DRAFT_518350 [Neocallimastix californiae]
MNNIVYKDIVEIIIRNDKLKLENYFINRNIKINDLSNEDFDVLLSSFENHASNDIIDLIINYYTKLGIPINKNKVFDKMFLGKWCTTQNLNYFKSRNWLTV